MRNGGLGNVRTTQATLPAFTAWSVGTGVAGVWVTVGSGQVEYPGYVASVDCMVDVVVAVPSPVKVIVPVSVRQGS